MKQSSIGRKYARILRGTGILVWLNSVLFIPVQLLVAGQSAQLAAYAIDGDVRGVAVGGCILLALVLGWRAGSAILHFITEERKEKSLHKCKMVTYAHCLEMPLSKLYDSGQGEILERLRGDSEAVMGRIYIHLPELCAEALAVAAYFGALLYQNPVLAVIFLAMAMAQLFPPLVEKRFISRNYDQYQETEERITDLTVEGYRGFLTIKMYGLKQWYLDRMEKLHKSYRRMSYALSAVEAAKYSMEQVAEYVLKYGACLTAGIFVLKGIVSAETGIYAITLSASLFGAVKGIFSVIPSLTKAKVSEKRLAEWDAAVKQPSHLKGQGHLIRLKEMGCSREGNPVFKSLSCTFDLDKINVIKGDNGAGKSTLLRLLAGLIEGQGGTMETWAQEGAFFYLPQERNGMDITGKELLELMSLTDNQGIDKHLTEFQIYETLLEQKLNTLSGGEEKRLFLAVGLADRDRAVLLDEPTNSLDQESRGKLLEMLSSRKGGAMIVTHEDIFDKIADCIYVVGKGGISLAER